MKSDTIHSLDDHFYRHESGRLTSLLTSRFGLQNIELIEDAVQEALLRSLDSWKLGGLPDNPPAWLYRVATNCVLDALRRQQTVKKSSAELQQHQARLHADSQSEPGACSDSNEEESILRMMCVCCHEKLSAEARISLSLKTLCGFSIAEISQGLLTNTETTKKRITRAKKFFIDERIPFEIPVDDAFHKRIESMHLVLYLLFTEGYNSSRPDTLIRREICAEAIRLCQRLIDREEFSTPATHALLALMLFHAARFEARLDNEGCILLMDQQDRGLWDKSLIAAAAEQLQFAATGRELTRYHLEAGIAATHCLAPSFKETNWDAILKSYDLLMKFYPSPVVALNRAVVIAQLEGPREGINAIQNIRGMELLKNYHLLEATLGEMYLRCNELSKARSYFLQARNKTTSHTEQLLLDQKLKKCE